MNRGICFTARAVWRQCALLAVVLFPCICRAGINRGICFTARALWRQCALLSVALFPRPACMPGAHSHRGGRPYGKGGLTKTTPGLPSAGDVDNSQIKHQSRRRLRYARSGGSCAMPVSHNRRARTAPVPMAAAERLSAVYLRRIPCTPC